MDQQTGLLGDFKIKRGEFAHLDLVFKQFETKEFKGLIYQQKSDKINRELLSLIRKEPEPCFLLPHVLGFIQRVDRENLLHHYTFTNFELWLNLSSTLDFEENYRIRAKIAGKWVDRSAYQALFPIGMGKVYEGTHFVTAHKSPDLDTTVASFWGWVDAFAARVSEGLHVWNLPGGPPPSQIEIEWAFEDIFGPAVFTHLPKTRPILNLSSFDLLSQKGFIRKSPEESLANADHGQDSSSAIVVDQEGFYLGDWRHGDAEDVQQVIVLLSSCLRWFENHLHLQLISLFAKKTLHFDEIEPFLKQLFELPVRDCEPAKEFSKKQKAQVEKFLIHVLGLPQGLQLTFEELGMYLAAKGQTEFQGVDLLIQQMQKDQLFDSQGNLLEIRPKIFHFLEQVVKTLHEAIFKMRRRLECFDIALKTKSAVFDRNAAFVGMNADVEEIRADMGNHLYLTVAYPDQGRFFPVGIIRAEDIRKPSLGTVSLRDFCNRDEMGIPSYLDIISVIDHHKSILNTASAPMVIIMDAQSSNSVVADQAIAINDQYSLLGQNESALLAHMAEVQEESTSSSRRLLMRLLQRRQTAETRGSFYVHPDREFTEYLHCLYGILDDTDLLSKISVFDLEIVVQLLNRLKSLSLKKETEIIDLSDLPRNKQFSKNAAQRILQNKDMYSLYSKVYAYREQEVARNLELAAEAKSFHLFADTKEQNGCCRVGQAKIFVNNVALFENRADEIRRVWVSRAQEVYQKRGEIDLHLQLISTVVSADEVYQGAKAEYTHKDELWLWIAGTEASFEHLKYFISHFQYSAGLKNNSLEVEFLGNCPEEFSSIFLEHFGAVEQTNTPWPGFDSAIAVLKFNPGTLNSRKAMVSPYLPTL
jgi:hypothetical protein